MHLLYNTSEHNGKLVHPPLHDAPMPIAEVSEAILVHACCKSRYRVLVRGFLSVGIGKVAGAIGI